MANKILLIDDSKTQLDVMKLRLSKCGYEIETAQNGLEGYNKVFSFIPDIILSDIIMPELDGYQLCRLLKNNKLTKNIPIILLTVLDKKLDEFWGKKAGAQIFISKTAEFSEIHEKIDEQLRETSLTESDKENIKNVYECYAHNSIEKCMKDLEKNLDDLCETSIKLLDSTLIEPGVYDIITSPAITGLIAHEAFGHGVELDMFLKNRAKAKNYIDEYVASPLITMHDGASSCLSQASYFFDDDGVLAQDTVIIEKGILKRGISDLVSAMELKMEPTGNGRRQNPFHKSYSRMTNTFFEAGESKKNDMIKSIKHGYLLCQMDNGMEDPKNWNIQCTCAYAKEIVNGKFSGKIVAPVVMSGNVLDLLKSITAVSKEFEIHGSGHCGKGHKEWVPVSDGGPYLKARCKLG